MGNPLERITCQQNGTRHIEQWLLA